MNDDNLGKAIGTLLLLLVFVVCMAISAYNADPPQPPEQLAEAPGPELVDIHDHEGRLQGIGEVRHDDAGRRVVYSSNGTTGKYVATTHQAIENRISWVDTLGDSNNNVHTKAVTVYYVVAEDGTFCEVKMAEFFKARKGHMWYSKHWRKE